LYLNVSISAGCLPGYRAVSGEGYAFFFYSSLFAVSCLFSLCRQCEPCPSREVAWGGAIGFSILLIFGLCSLSVFRSLLVLSPSLSLFWLSAGLLVMFYLIWNTDGLPAEMNQRALLDSHKPFTMENRVRPNLTFSAKIVLGILQVATSLATIVEIPWPQVCTSALCCAFLPFLFFSLFCSFFFWLLDVQGLPWLPQLHQS
jgi:hypothetical protein